MSSLPYFGGKVHCGRRVPIARHVWLLLTLTVSAAQSTIAQEPQGRPPQGRFALEVETGPVWQTRNDVRIPNEGGTTFSFVDLLGSGPYPAVRGTFTWNITRRHGLSVLVAPLTLSGIGRFDEPVAFAGENFAPGEPTEGTYRFNSYRLTYRYLLFTGETWTWALGLTAKVRDAKVTLRQGATSADYSNVGFVPLIHLGAQARFSDRWRLVADLDAAGASQGRAEDFSLKLYYDPGPRWAIGAGYRMLEGGANVDDVYSFAWLHYGVVSVTFRF